MRKKVSFAQGQLPFNGTTRVLVHPHRLERRAIATIIVLCALSMCAYGAGIGLSISRTAQTARALSEGKALASAVATLEGEYLANTRGITHEYGKAHGFVASNTKVFVSRQTVTLADLNAR